MGGHEQLQGKRIDQLSFRIQLVEGLFVKYANVLECKVPGRQFFWQHSATSDRKTFYKQDHKDGMLFIRGTGRGRKRCISVTHVTDSVWNAFETTTPSSISKVIKYYSFIIFISFCAKINFKMQWCRFSDCVYFSERNVKIRMKRKLFIPDLLLLKWHAFSTVNV
jgi:hypothetical protein